MAGPVLSHRQRFDESNARSVTNLVGALQAIKAAKDDAEAKRRAGLQDQMTNLQIQQGQQAVSAGQMALDKQKQETGLVSQFTDQIDREMNPGAVNEPALPGQPSAFDVSPLMDNGAKKKGDDFKYSIIAKRRAMNGKESTPDMVRQEYEAAAAQNADTMDAASKNPQIRALDLSTRTANQASIEANTAKTKKETELLGIPKPEDMKNLAGMEDDLRQELVKNAGEFVKVRDAHSRIKSVTKSPSAAGDLALIFNFMKMLDPGSTVRETEFANAENAKGVDENVRSMWNKLKTGERLTEDQRKDFLGQAEALYSSQKAFADQAKGYYGELAKRRGLNADNVINVLDMPGEPGAGPLKVGRFQVEAAD